MYVSVCCDAEALIKTEDGKSWFVCPICGKDCEVKQKKNKLDDLFEEEDKEFRMDCWKEDISTVFHRLASFVALKSVIKQQRDPKKFVDQFITLWRENALQKGVRKISSVQDRNEFMETFDGSIAYVTKLLQQILDEDK